MRAPACARETTMTPQNRPQLKDQMTMDNTLTTHTGFRFEVRGARLED